VKKAYSVHLHRKGLVNAKQWIFDFLQRESKTSATVLANVVWHIWEACNDTRNNGTVVLPSRVAAKVLSYVDMILTHMGQPKEASKAASSLRSRWTAPPEGVTCINVDAALFPEEHRMGCGAVLRDHNGTFILSVSEGLGGMPLAEMAEALAVRRALTISRAHGVSRAILISDCLSLIQRIVSRQSDRSYLGTVIADIKSLASDFVSCTFKFARRELNVVAHKLARSAEPLVCNISVGVILDYIQEELCNDII
jgi:ribonuclease HI